MGVLSRDFQVILLQKNETTKKASLVCLSRILIKNDRPRGSQPCAVPDGRQRGRIARADCLLTVTSVVLFEYFWLWHESEMWGPACARPENARAHG